MLLFSFPCVSFLLVNVRSDILKGDGENISGCILIDGEDKIKISEKLGKRKRKKKKKKAFLGVITFGVSEIWPWTGHEQNDSYMCVCVCVLQGSN